MLSTGLHFASESTPLSDFSCWLRPRGRPFNPVESRERQRAYRRRLQPNYLARIAHPDPLRWHRSSFGVAKGAT